ncbi:hypothetical protein WN51_11733 [Melipona quadrifasciata]|uniref:Uncharacterized protein n=1 Tax=Melipona quadrifasciata TaxID=166423 RepID=A0A0M9A3L8_9HYME|nr:hypothetical protein WN51_11733 [Melipona quadrifasciata]
MHVRKRRKKEKERRRLIISEEKRSEEEMSTDSFLEGNETLGSQTRGWLHDST